MGISGRAVFRAPHPVSCVGAWPRLSLAVWTEPDTPSSYPAEHRGENGRTPGSSTHTRTSACSCVWYPLGDNAAVVWPGTWAGVWPPPPVPLPPAAGSGSGQGLGSPGPCTSRLPTPCHTHTVISLIFVFQPRFSRLRSVIGEGNTVFLQGKRSLQGPEDRPESVPSLPSPKAPPPQRVCERSRVPEGRPSRPVSRPRGLTPSHPHPGRADRASGHAIPPLEAAGLGLHLRIPPPVPRARARPAPRSPCQATGDWLGPASTEHSPGGAPLRPRGHVRRPWGGGSGAAHRRPARCE